MSFKNRGIFNVPQYFDNINHAFLIGIHMYSEYIICICYIIYDIVFDVVISLFKSYYANHFLWHRRAINEGYYRVLRTLGFKTYIYYSYIYIYMYVRVNKFYFTYINRYLF